ncbi:MAG: acyltransferase [Deltaproteobacteria bacterium]|nr:acyltransferase [Deltaproteobacteria bacterium]
MKSLAAYLRNIFLSMRLYEFGRHNYVDPGVMIVHPEYVSIGDNVIIHKDTLIHVAAKEKIKGRPIVKIGNRVHLGFRCWIAARLDITIEDDVGIASNVTIQDYIHSYEDVTRPIKDQPLTGEAPIRIGRGTVLGANVIVLPGVTVGEHCMIGGNSVIAKDIPPYSVAVGNPARVVKVYDRELGKWTRVE